MLSEVQGGAPRHHWPEDSGEGEGGLTGDVVRLVDAAHPAAARVAAGQRLEMEPRFGAGMTDGLESATAFRARDGGQSTVPDGEYGSKLWIGRVDHRGVLGTTVGRLGSGRRFWGAGAPKGISGGR